MVDPLKRWREDMREGIRQCTTLVRAERRRGEASGTSTTSNTPQHDAACTFGAMPPVPRHEIVPGNIPLSPGFTIFTHRDRAGTCDAHAKVYFSNWLGRTACSFVRGTFVLSTGARLVLTVFYLVWYNCAQL